MSNTSKKTRDLVVISLFAAIIVVLQVLATFIKIGSFPLTLTLIPIVVAGAMYGVGIGTLMGAIFGVVVMIMTVTGADAVAFQMFTIHPVITVIVCILKGALAGFVSAAVCKWAPVAPTFIAAAVCPIVNTVTLYLTLIFFFTGTAFESTISTLFLALISVNFLIELALNLILAPSIIRIVNAAKRR